MLYKVKYLRKSPARYGVNVPSGIYDLPAREVVVVPEDVAHELRFINAQNPDHPVFAISEVQEEKPRRKKKIVAKTDDVEQRTVVKKRKKIKRHGADN